MATYTQAGADTAFKMTTSRHFLSWLTEQGPSIALTAYQIGKLFLLGLKANGDLSIFERSFNRCTAMCPTSNGYYMSSLYRVRRFENLFTNDEHPSITLSLQNFSMYSFRRIVGLNVKGTFHG